MAADVTTAVAARKWWYRSSRMPRSARYSILPVFRPQVWETDFPLIDAQYARKSISLVTLKKLIQFGQPPLSSSALLESARYTRSELPVRLTRRVLAFQHLPFIVGTNPYIQSVYRKYFDTFETIRTFPEITNEEIDGKFTEMLSETVENHSENIPMLAKGKR